MKILQNCLVIAEFGEAHGNAACSEIALFSLPLMPF